MISHRIACAFATALLVCVHSPNVVAQPAPPAKAKEIAAATESLAKSVARLKALAKTKDDYTFERLIPDVEVYVKAAEWIARHDEFYAPNYADHTLAALQTGAKRAAMLEKGDAPWTTQTGSTVRGYESKVDGSVQPYAVSLPEGVNPRAGKRWPLHVKLHGRAGKMNEVNFIQRHDGKAVGKDQSWIQLDVFGRTNNAYRWSGETDVFEAIAAVQADYRIDRYRVTLHGFSMGGAGAWHLGLHHPHLWSSVGPGAGFIDFYKYQKQAELRPSWQHKTLGIYDSVDYALNAFNVPVCTYGGEMDAQLIASTGMVAVAKRMDVEMKLVIGKGVGHKFTPEGFEEFMAFHLDKSERGRPRFPGSKEIRFITRTLKYNRCEWLTVEEVIEQYKPAVVIAKVDKNGDLVVATQNVAVMRIARDVASLAKIDGSVLPLGQAAEGLLPDVYYEKGAKEWYDLAYMPSKDFPDNKEARKRHNLQGPIDDAFMEPFVCVRGTGKPWSPAQHDWAAWTLARFEQEFDKWLRGKVPVVNDSDLTEAMIDEKNIVLFGDPGSNSVLKSLLEQLPVKWDESGFEVNGVRYDPKTHGVSFIFPNPRNPRRYVVVNSGHTMHEADFKASNAWLFPRLGDIGVQSFKKTAKGYDESIVWAEIFNSAWRLPLPEKTASK
ncbi:MAG: prolyl oligopeptidase family serine peptidase [Planctomycetota bacterium]|nr:prolyl oligopeptidase family serine peptidase [Planctomycetota bacterium]